MTEDQEGVAGGKLMEGDLQDPNTATAALAKAIEGGYREPAPPSRDQRAATLIADVEHAMQNNGPMTIAMLTEMRALLLGSVDATGADTAAGV